MKFRGLACLLVLASTGCAAIPSGDDGLATELRVARRDAAADLRAIHAIEEQNRLLAGELQAERAAAAERAEHAELVRRIDALERTNEKLAQVIAKGDRIEAASGGGDDAPSTLINPTDDELRRLRANLAEAGFGPYTLTPAQVRALLRVLRPPRPIDTNSPFAL
jgi:hypothetical protein